MDVPITYDGRIFEFMLRLPYYRQPLCLNGSIINVTFAGQDHTFDINDPNFADKFQQFYMVMKKGLE
jgi:hypothetical protein